MVSPQLTSIFIQCKCKKAFFHFINGYLCSVSYNTKWQKIAKLILILRDEKRSRVQISLEFIILTDNFYFLCFGLSSRLPATSQSAPWNLLLPPCCFPQTPHFCYPASCVSEKITDLSNARICNSLWYSHHEKARPLGFGFSSFWSSVLQLVPHLMIWLFLLRIVTS